MKRVYQHIILIFLIVITSSCIEPFEVATQSFENLLVIEAKITNEFKYHEIKLSRTYRLEDEDPSYEMNANVSIVDDFQNTYNFQEIDSGVYRSFVKFKAELGKSYQLFITKSDGKSYMSEKEQINSEKGLDSVYAKISADDFGNEGISIFADSYDPSGNSKYYRYEYEETKKIILPYWSGLKLIVVSDVFPYDVQTRAKTEKDRVCYSIKNSNDIIQNTTANLSEDRVSIFLIKFLPKDDYFLIYGYSILVKQYIQSEEAYNYYKVLKKISNSGNIFSQVQSGALKGNVFSTTNENEKTLGFFEVVSMSSKRIQFKYRNIYPTGFFPRFKQDCSTIAPPIARGHYPESDRSPLIEAIRQGDYIMYDFNPDYLITIEQGKYLMVPKECGDCRVYGTNIKPDYWID